tara:strand:+ start:207 stop:1019 length:813 start_codon:yes stop_codon:yes gene_type:complete
MLLGASDATAWAVREAGIRATASPDEIDGCAARGDLVALAALAARKGGGAAGDRAFEAEAAAPSPRLPRVQTFTGCRAWFLVDAVDTSSATPQLQMQPLSLLTNGLGYESGAADANRWDAPSLPATVLLVLPRPLELCAVKIAAGNALNGGDEALQSFELHAATGDTVAADAAAAVGLTTWSQLGPARTYRKFADTLAMTQRPQLFPTAGQVPRQARGGDAELAELAEGRRATPPSQQLGVAQVVAIKIVLLSSHGATCCTLRQIGVRGR